MPQIRNWTVNQRRLIEFDVGTKVHRISPAPRKKVMSIAGRHGNARRLTRYFGHRRSFSVFLDRPVAATPKRPADSPGVMSSSARTRVHHVQNAVA